MGEKRAEARSTLGRSRRPIFLLGLIAAWAAVLAWYAVVAFVDPYELRFSRAGERLADHAYPGYVVPKLFSVAANEGADVVVVGGSTAMGFTPAMLRAAFPGTKRPVNLSYTCATGDDLGLTLPRLEASKTLKRVIISLDFTMVWPCETFASTLDSRYYALRWWDPVPDFSMDRRFPVLLRNVLRTGVLNLPDWQQHSPDQVDGVTDAPPVTASPSLLASFHRRVIAARPWATKGSVVPCSAIPAVRDVIAPNVRRLAARGVAVDLLSPPYALAFYGVHGQPAQHIFTRLMALRRCALEATAGLPGVHFHAFDDDLPLVGSMANYKDAGHLRGYSTYQYVLAHIVAGDRELWPPQWPAFQARVIGDVLAFDPAVARPAIGR
jgi:hypothetical protein